VTLYAEKKTNFYNKINTPEVFEFVFSSLGNNPPAYGNLLYGELQPSCFNIVYKSIHTDSLRKYQSIPLIFFPHEVSTGFIDSTLA